MVLAPVALLREGSRLFPDLPLVQARLEKYLLRPKDDILRMAKNAVRSAGGCAVGVHLRHHEAYTTVHKSSRRRVDSVEVDDGAVKF